MFTHWLAICAKNQDKFLGETDTGALVFEFGAFYVTINLLTRSVRTNTAIPA